MSWRISYAACKCAHVNIIVSICGLFFDKTNYAYFLCPRVSSVIQERDGLHRISSEPNVLLVQARVRERERLIESEFIANPIQMQIALHCISTRACIAHNDKP